ncbi:MAG: hypothetical protein MK110_15335 [Fuerstiella sp.]|nr:hypothetical protein [Fuerstiella sp.]
MSIKKNSDRYARDSPRCYGLFATIFLIRHEQVTIAPAWNAVVFATDDMLIHDRSGYGGDVQTASFSS